MAAPLGGDARLRGARRAGRARVLRARDVPVPLRAHPHGPRAQLLDRRRDRAPAADGGLARAPPDGLGRLRAAGRERRHRARRPPGALDRRQHRPHAPAAPPARLLVRLGARARHLRPALLPLGAALLPAHARARPRLQAPLAGQLVRALRDRARQRAGGGRPLLALRRPGRRARARAVVLPHHGLRRGAAPRPGPPDRLARARAHHAAELDRAEPGRGDPLSPRGPRRRRRGLHHAR